ncbi:hypothetical protein JW859_08545 [bacterium]|nr:hypothetical protein [bacterium]
MRILQIDAARFGVLNVEKPIEFSNGLNLWISRNQAGKTTLLTFLEWMLYGPLATRGQRDPKGVERWTPWSGGQPMGRLVIQPELPNWPGEMMVSARFNDYFIQLSEYRTQKTLTDRVEVNKNGEWNLGQQLLNLSRESFRLSLSALQENLVEPLRGGSLRQMVTSDLGKLVENPDVAKVDRLLGSLETPMFHLDNGPARTIKEHKIDITRELDILGLERKQLEQRLGEFRELITERDTLSSQLEQQERVVQGLERQANHLELARNYYLIEVARQVDEAPAEKEDWKTAHPEYMQITPELEQEVTKLATQLEVVEQELTHTQDEMKQLEQQLLLEEQKSHGSSDASVAAALQLREAAVEVERAHNDFQRARVRLEEVEGKIPTDVRNRYMELQKLFEPHAANLTAIMDWQKDHMKINEYLAELRERRADLQIMTRVKLPLTFYIGLGLAAFSWLPIPFAGNLGIIFGWVPYIIWALILVVAIVLMYPYWRMRKATGPAAVELREVIKPAIDEGLNQLGAQDRKRRRFIELYEIDRNTWDKLVDNILEYTQLDMQMREYTTALRDVEILKSRRDTAWVSISEVHPLAPLGVDMGWLNEQLAAIGGPAPTQDTLATLRARIDENRKDLQRLTAQRDQYASALEQRLAPVGFAAQLKQGLRSAVDGFRQVALRVNRTRSTSDRSTFYEEATRGLAMSEPDFRREWGKLNPAEQERLSQLASTQQGFDTACTRLRELISARQEASSQRDKLRQSLDMLRDDLTKYGQIDREAQRMNERTTQAQHRQVLLERWEKALDVSRRMIDSLVSRAGQEAAPEIQRELRKTLIQAPIAGVKDISLGSNLELMLSVEGAPASIPAEQLWTYLSTGAQKQVALALRLSMARTASGRTSLPLLLDEPLEELDDERAALLFDYITKLAESTQVVIMTCHQRLYKWLLEKHQEVHELPVAVRPTP